MALVQSKARLARVTMRAQRAAEGWQGALIVLKSLLIRTQSDKHCPKGYCLLEDEKADKEGGKWK